MALEQHGGNIYKASAEYGMDSSQILDYSANLNPLGMPAQLKDIFFENIREAENYPDPDCMALKEAISSYLDIGTDHIIIGNGASEVLSLLFNALLPKRVLIAVPTFSEYQQMAESVQCRVDFFMLHEQEEFRLDMERLIESLTPDMDAVILCNPNNPTSTLAAKEELESLLKASAEKKITVIIDETFIELTGGGNSNSVSDLLIHYQNLFIIRAFTKVLAIPGVRLGYGLGNRTLIQKMWGIKIPWSVNTFACLTAKFLPHLQEYLGQTQDWLISEKEYFYGQMLGIKGLKVYKPQTCFVLLKFSSPGMTSKKLRDQMARHGILVRDASNFLPLNNQFVRAAIKDRNRNEIFLKTIKNIMEGKI